jgi:1-acyl-sn-glycerol-3-phosphate acyltransferase
MSLRALFIFPLFIIITIGLSLVALLVAFFDPSGNRSHRVASLWASMLLLLSGARVRISNLSFVHPGQSYIFAANHQSAFDIPALLSKLKVQFRWLAKESLFRIPLFGWAMKRTGYIPIDRSNPRQAYQSLIQAAKQVQKGTSVLIFPEGTRQEGDRLGEFKKGGFQLALKSQQPIIPITIIGSNRILPKNSFKLRPGTVELILGEPIPTRGYLPKDIEALMAKVREAIERPTGNKV